MRRGEQDLSLLQIPASQCQPPASLHPPTWQDRAQTGHGLQVPCNICTLEYLCLCTYSVCVFNEPINKTACAATWPVLTPRFSIASALLTPHFLLSSGVLGRQSS